MILGNVSGAHHNPAVTLAFHNLKDAPTDQDKSQARSYIFAQVIGGLLAMVVAVLLSQDGLDDDEIMTYNPSLNYLESPVDLNTFS